MNMHIRMYIIPHPSPTCHWFEAVYALYVIRIDLTASISTVSNLVVDVRFDLPIWQQCWGLAALSRRAQARRRRLNPSR